MSQVGWSNESFAIALTYINWETDAIVGVELLQNVGIAIVCIFVTTLITLGRYIIMIRSMTCLTCRKLARLGVCDAVCAAHLCGRGRLHALVGHHHRDNLHEHRHHQCRAVCGLLCSHHAWLSHNTWIKE